MELSSAREKILFLEQKLKMNNEMLRLNNIKYDDCKVAFFTGILIMEFLKLYQF